MTFCSTNSPPCSDNSTRSTLLGKYFLSAALFAFLHCFAPAAYSAQEKQSADEKESIEKTQEEKGAFSDHIRIRRDHRGRAWSMDTAITRFEVPNKNGKIVYVDLIGAVHVGEKEYYQALNERFEIYDSMLYELVAPEGTVVPKGGGERGVTNPVAGMQLAMMAGLDLNFQLEEVDYTPDNFVHADMTPEEFAESWSENNESVGRILLKSMGHGIAMQSKGQGPSNFSLLAAGLSKNPTLKLRRVAAEQMIAMEAGMSIFDGDDGSTIIEHRNAKVMKILQREIDAGNRKIGIFYGAGHLKDMQERLENDFEMKRAGKTWLPAWKLREPRSSK